jgi:hypothetical protein
MSALISKKPSFKLLAVTDLICTDNDGVGSYIIVLSIRLGPLRLEYIIDTPRSCTPDQWDAFLNHGADSIGTESQMWIDRCVSEGQCEEILYSLAGYNKETSLSLHIPGNILLPSLRPAVHALFKKRHSCFGPRYCEEDACAEIAEEESNLCRKHTEIIPV